MSIFTLAIILLTIALIVLTFLLILWKKNALYYKNLSEHWERRCKASNEANKKLMADNLKLVGEKELLSVEFEQFRKDRDRYYRIAHSVDRSRLRQINKK